MTHSATHTRQILSTGFFALILLALIGSALYLYPRHPSSSDPSGAEAVDSRIAPVGAVYAGDAGKAALAAAQEAAAKTTVAQAAHGDPVENKTENKAEDQAASKIDGKAIFDSLCQACHTNAAIGAPLLTDKAAWKDRLAQGEDVLVKHAIDGFTGKKGTMPPRGGNPSLSDAQIAAAVEWMTAQVK